MLSDLIKNKTESFQNLCKTHQIKLLYAFGSSVNGNFTPSSDVDLLVEIGENDPLKRGELLMSLWDKLEIFFKRKVDLLTPESLRNPVLKAENEKTKKMVYNAQEGMICMEV